MTPPPAASTPGSGFSRCNKRAKKLRAAAVSSYFAPGSQIEVIRTLLRIESRLHLLEPQEALDQQSGADQQHERERDFAMSRRLRASTARGLRRCAPPSFNVPFTSSSRLAAPGARPKRTRSGSKSPSAKAQHARNRIRPAPSRGAPSGRIARSAGPSARCSEQTQRCRRPERATRSRSAIAGRPVRVLRPCAARMAISL